MTELKMTAYNQHFFRHFDIDMSRVGLRLHALKSEGVGIEKHKDYSVIFQRSPSAQEYICTFDTDVFILMIFLDQYRGTDKPLPKMPTQSFLQRYSSSLIKLRYDDSRYQTALTILRDNTIITYSQLVQLITALRAQELIGEEFIKSTTFGEKLEDWYFGDKHKYDGSAFMINSEGYWDLMQIEKGNGRPIMTFYDIKYVYQYLLNLYLPVL